MDRRTAALIVAWNSAPFYRRCLARFIVWHSANLRNHPTLRTAEILLGRRPFLVSALVLSLVAAGTQGGPLEDLAIGLAVMFAIIRTIRQGELMTV